MKKSSGSQTSQFDPFWQTNHAITIKLNMHFLAFISE